MSKRPLEELDSRNNIVIVPAEAFPAKKPKLDSVPEPPLPPGLETLELDDIPVPPPPLPPSDPHSKPPNMKLLCESDKIETKTTVISEKPIESSVTTATLNTAATTEEKTSGSEARKCEPEQSKFAQSSWASKYLMSIGQTYRKPIKINLSTRRNSVLKESPLKDETNDIVTNAGERDTDVEIKKTELLVKQKSAKDNPQTSNPIESNSTRYATKVSENIPANNPQNILDVPTLSLHHSLANRAKTLDPIREQTGPLAAEKYRALQTPLNPSDIDYYNYNTSNISIPHMHIPINKEHDIDYYRYNARHSYFEHPIHEHYRISHAYKAHYEQGRVANDRSYLDVKIDEFLAKVSRDPSHGYRCDKTKETSHKKSLSLKRYTTEPRRETREIYRENRDGFIKKPRTSEERKHTSTHTSEEYKDFTQSAKKSYVSSKIILGNSREDYKTKINIKDEKIREDSKEDSIKNKYENKKSVSKPKRTADYNDRYKRNDLCKSKNQTESNKRGRRSHSSESSDDSSSESSEEPKQNKTKRENKRKSSSEGKEKSPFHVSRRSEIHDENKKTIGKEKSSKTNNTSPVSNRSRGSEEQEYTTSKRKRDEREKTSNDKEKKSEEIEHKSKTKQYKERPPSKDKYTFLKETIKQKIKKAKDEIKRLRRQQREKSPDEVKSKYSNNDKPSTSKQPNGRNYESSSEKSMKRIANQVNNNAKLDINEPFDLRSKLSRQNLSQFITKIREENSKIPENVLEKRENLVITVANDCDETETVEKSTEKEEKSKKNKNKKVKKIQLVINVVCEESDSSESEDNTASKETNKTNKENKKSSSLSAEDLSFLDDLNIDEIVNSLTSTHKDRELDANKICANNVTSTNKDDHVIIDDDSDDSDASTVHLEEVERTHGLYDNDQLNKTGSEEKEHKNKLPYNLVKDSNNVPLLKQRSKEKKDECTESLCERDNAVKIKEEVSDTTYCTPLNKHKKEKENSSVETTSSAKLDEKALFKKLFTPMMEIKIEPIEILSDDETPTIENPGNCKLGDSTFNTTTRGSGKLSETQTKESVTKDSKTTQSKTEPIKALNVLYSLPVPMNIKSEFAESDENTAPANNDAPGTSDQITHLLEEIKEEPREIEEIAVKLIAPLTTNTSEKTTKAHQPQVSTCTSNILEDSTPQSEIKIEPVETISHEEVSGMNTKENYIATMQPEKHVLTEVEKIFKILHGTYACANSNKGNSEYFGKTKTSNSETTNRNSEQAMTEMVINKALNNSHIISRNASVKESQKVVPNQELDEVITDLIRKSNDASLKSHNVNKDASKECDELALPKSNNVVHYVEPKQVTISMKEDVVQKHLMETQTKKDMEISTKKEQSKSNEQTRTTLFTKDASNIASSLSSANDPKSLTVVSASQSLTPANISKIPSTAIKTAALLSISQSATPSNNPRETNLLSAQKSTGPVNAPTTSTAASSVPDNNLQKTNLLPAPKCTGPENTLKITTVLSTSKSANSANNPEKTNLLSVPKSTGPVNAPKTLTVIPTVTSSNPANNLLKTSLLSVPKSTGPVDALKTVTVIPTVKNSVPANNPQKTSLLSVPKSTYPVDALKTVTVIPTVKNSVPANNPQKTSLLSVPKSTGPVDALKTVTVISTAKNSIPANNPRKTNLLSVPKSAVPVNAPKTLTVIPTATSSIPANNPQNTNLLSVPKSTGPVDAPKTVTVIPTAKNLIPANNSQKTNLFSVPKSTGPVNAPKTVTVIPTAKNSIPANNPQKTGLLSVPKSTGPVDAPKTVTVIPTAKNLIPANNSQKTNLFSVPKSTGPVNAPKTVTVIPTAKNLIPANNSQKTNLLSVPKSTGPVNAPKTVTVIPTAKNSIPANNPQKTDLFSVPKSTGPVNAPKTVTVIPTAKNSIPANNPQKTGLLPVPKSTGSVNAPKTISLITTAKSSIPANNPQKTSLPSVPKSTGPVNVPKTVTVIPTAKNSIPANNPQKTSLLSVPRSTGPVNAPSISVISTASNSIPAKNPQKANLLPVPSQSSVNTLKTTTLLPTPKIAANNPQKTGSLPVPKVNSKPSTASIKTSTPSPVPKTSTNATTSNKPEINDANGKPLTQSEKTFLDNTLKQRMQQYLKTSYTITQLIRRGRFSKILKCSDEQGNEMAVKVISEQCDRYEMGVHKEAMLVKLQKDITEDNLHFVRLHDGFSVGNQWSFLMDYYPKNLKQVLEESATPFHIDRVQQLSRQLVTAVAVLRNNNIVHSDIKPHHLLLNSTNDRIKLCGFDQATYGQRKPLPNIGSINYRAPEIILGYSTGFSMDVWSTALVMYEMATKLQLFPGFYNNDILFKQICTLGYIPVDMLRLSQFAHMHFKGTVFMRRQGGKGQDITYFSEHEMFRNNKLVGTLWGVYHSEWGCQASNKQKQRDLAKLYEFCQLLQQMLEIHPKHRLSIEFAYASHFLLDGFT